jgi:hypothetical protein
MTQFGKRVAVGYAASPSRPRVPTDVDEALVAVATGKLPAWTTAGPIKLTIGLLLFAAGLYFITVTYAGDLLRDLRLSGTWQAAYDLRVVEGSCTRHNFVVTRCSARIQSNAEPNQAPIAIAFMMLFSGGGGEVLVPLRSTTNPSAVAIAYAAETKLANRTITFLVLTGALLGMLIAVLGALATGHYKGGAAHDDLLDGIAALQARAESTQTLSGTA